MLYYNPGSGEITYTNGTNTDVTFNSINVGTGLFVNGVSTFSNAVYINPLDITPPDGLPLSPALNIVQQVPSAAPIYNLNASSGTTASADFTVVNDRYATQTIYGDFGINSSRYNGGGAPFSDPNGTYMYAAGGTLSLGTANALDVKFVAGGSYKMNISGTTDAVSIPFGPSNSLTDITKIALAQALIA
jgi:hypothetical protein